MKTPKSLLVIVLLIVSTWFLPSVAAGDYVIRLQKDVARGQLSGVPTNVTFDIYDSETASTPVASQTFAPGEWWVDYDFYKYNPSHVSFGYSNVRFYVDFSNTAALTTGMELWIEIALDGAVKGIREQVRKEPWGVLKNVATRIVAASDTPNANVRADYVCDGTDDQAEIQAAIDDLGSNGGVVYLLEGTYNISNSINMAIGASLIGVGKGTVLKVVTDVTNLNVINASEWMNGILISQLVIDGNNKTGSSNNGIYFNRRTYNSKIDKVWVENMSGVGIY